MKNQNSVPELPKGPIPHQLQLLEEGIEHLNGKLLELACILVPIRCVGSQSVNDKDDNLKSLSEVASRIRASKDAIDTMILFVDTILQEVEL